MLRKSTITELAKTIATQSIAGLEGENQAYKMNDSEKAVAKYAVAFTLNEIFKSQEDWILDIKNEYLNGT
jgi:hypothetical protein